jgi:hypothetical protein
MSNLDAAEANLLRVAPDYYLAGQMPSLLNHVQRHLEPDDARRRELERIAARFGPDQAASANTDMAAITAQERNAIVSSVRASSKAALREQLRVRSFRNVLLVTSLVMTLLAVGVAVLGMVNPRPSRSASSPRSPARRWSSARPSSPPWWRPRARRARPTPTSTTSSSTPPAAPTCWWSS